MKSLLKKEVKSMLDEAIGHELYAHLLYANVANYMQSVGFFGAQKYFQAESASEFTHYQTLVDYINDRGDVANINSIMKMSDAPKTLAESFEIALEAESDLEKFYVTIYEKAEDAGDCITAQFLLQFMEIQRKAVGEIRDIMAILEICGDNSAALLELDEKLKNGL